MLESRAPRRRGGRSDFLRPIGKSKWVLRRALAYLEGDRWLHRHERRHIYYCRFCTIFHAFRMATAKISEFRAKSQFRCALSETGPSENGVTIVAILLDLTQSRSRPRIRAEEKLPAPEPSRPLQELEASMAHCQALLEPRAPCETVRPVGHRRPNRLTAARNEGHSARS